MRFDGTRGDTKGRLTCHIQPRMKGVHEVVHHSRGLCRQSPLSPEWFDTQDCSAWSQVSQYLVFRWTTRPEHFDTTMAVSALRKSNQIIQLTTVPMRAMSDFGTEPWKVSRLNVEISDHLSK